MAQVRLQLFVQSLLHFPPQFKYTAELQRGDRIAVFIRRRIQSFGLRYEFARIIHLSFEVAPEVVDFHVFDIRQQIQLTNCLFVKHTLCATFVKHEKSTNLLCMSSARSSTRYYFDINIYFGTHVVSTSVVFDNPWFMNSTVNHRVIIIL